MADENLTIETPEHVELHFALASIGNRFIACAIDHAIQILSIILTSVLAYRLSNGARRVGDKVVSGFSEGNLWIIALSIMAAFVLFFGYFVFFETVWSGQTPGKRWLKLRVIREDGRPISFFEAMVRNLLRVVDFIVPPFYSIGLISVFATDRDQRVGDLVAGTVVVRERGAEAPAFAEVFASPVSDPALRRTCKPVLFTADVNKLTEQEIVVVESFLRRRWDLKDYPRQWMAWRVSMPILFKLRPQYDLATFTYEGFLEELLHRYREKHRFID